MTLRIALYTICLAMPGFGQSAALRGIVTNSSGAPLAGVEVTVEDAGRQPGGRGTTNLSGEWSFPASSGHYRVSFHKSGFENKTLDMDPAGGDTTIVLANAEQKSEKSDDAGTAVRYQPVVDPERTHQADFITSRELLELPVNVRNYLNLAALTPGVSEVNDFVGITDAPLLQAPESGLSFGGNNGRGNVFWLDGGENYINTGGVRPSISQEAVAEFQVERSNYSAEFGGGIGGIVNIISRSGSNDGHGDVFGFLRETSLEARNFFSPQATAFTRYQTGATLGGPIRKDRTYVFLAFERLQREESTYVSLGRDRGPFHRLKKGQQAIADFFQASQIPQLVQLGTLTKQLLLTDNYPRVLALFDANRGVFPFSEASTQGSVRIDHKFSDNHNAFLRFNASTGNQQNANVEGLNAFDRGIVSDFSDQTVMLNDTYVISARLVSESRFSINRTRFNVANRDRIGPSIEIAGYGLFGKDWTLPSDYGEWHGQLQQNFFYTPGRHSIRIGTDINPVRASSILQTNSGGRFTFGEYLPLGAFYGFLTRDPNATATLSATLRALGRAALVSNLSSPLTAIQAFDVGAPSVYIQNFGNPQWQGWFQRYNFFFNDVYRPHPRVTLNAGLRYEFEAAPAVLAPPSGSLAPRLALAWAATKDQKTVIRAGFGLFYLRHQTQLATAVATQSGSKFQEIVVPLSGLPGSVNPATGLPVTSADIYQRLSVEGVIGKRPILASDLAQFGIVPGPNVPYQVRFQKPVDFEHAYAEQASLQIERALGRIAVSAAYNFTRAAHLPRIRDLNAAYGPPDTSGQPAIVPRDPLIAQLLTFESAANSFYHALTVQALRRFSPHLTFDVHYTFSKSIDEVTDINFLPNNSLNARQDRGLSTFDQRHRLVGSSVIDLPGARWHGFLGALFGGFTLSPIVTAASGRPFNVVTGIDFNSSRPAGAGRNIGQGPAFVSVEGRISRTIRLRRGDSKAALEFIAEGFNLLNHTNFKRLNNTVGQITVNDLPHPLVGVRGDIANPLSFVSAFDPRQIQLAVKLKW